MIERECDVCGKPFPQIISEDAMYRCPVCKTWHYISNGKTDKLREDAYAKHSLDSATKAN